jgi:hypothetical protein
VVVAREITLHVDTEALLSVFLGGRYRLIGDEDTGVGIECRDHFDGGRPLGYYQSPAYRSPYPDEVVSVDTIPALLAVAVDHEACAHGPEGQPSVNIPAAPDSIPRARVLDLVKSLGIDPHELESFELTRNGVRAVVFAVDPEGRRYSDDGENFARHHITIPITDGPDTRKIGREVVDTITDYEARMRTRDHPEPPPDDPEPQPA